MLRLYVTLWSPASSALEWDSSPLRQFIMRRLAGRQFARLRLIAPAYAQLREKNFQTNCNSGLLSPACPENVTVTPRSPSSVPGSWPCDVPPRYGSVPPSLRLTSKKGPVKCRLLRCYGSQPPNTPSLPCLLIVIIIVIIIVILIVILCLLFRSRLSAP